MDASEKLPRGRTNISVLSFGTYSFRVVCSRLSSPWWLRPGCDTSLVRTLHWIDIACWESDDLNRSPLRSRFPCRFVIDSLLWSLPSLDEVFSWRWIDPTVLPGMSRL